MRLLLRHRILRLVLLGAPASLGTPLLAQTPRSLPPAATPSGAATAISAADPEAGKRIAEAIDAVQANRLEDAQRALDAAAALSPAQPGLWATYGSLDLAHHNLAAAITDFQKELTFHPSFSAVYRPLATTQVLAGDRQAAAATLRAWETADPSNPTPAAMLVSVLREQGLAPEAVRVGEAEVTRLPPGARDDVSLQFALGSAELEAGDHAKGAALLAEVLRSGPDLTMRNSAAYLLADAGQHLPLAEASERDLLDRLILDTEGWTLNEDVRTLRAGTALLAASWDTMGWILFREKKLAEAEILVRAAWRNSQHATIGEHLAEIEDARRAYAPALADFELAMATISKDDAGSTPESKKIARELEGRIATARKVAGRKENGGAAVALRRLRTLSLGGSGSGHGEARYKLLLSRGKVVRSAPLAGANAAMPGASASLAHADFGPWFPPGSLAQLVITGTLRCATAACTFEVDP